MIRNLLPIHSSQKTMLLVIEAMPEGVLVLDTQNRIINCNPAARQILGVDNQTIMGQPAGVVLSKWANITTPFDPTLEAYPELVNIGASHFELRIFPFYDRRHRLSGRVVMLRNITQWVQAQSEIQEAHNKLEQQLAERAAELLHVNQQLRQEIGERYRVEDSLRQSEERFRRVIISISDHVYVTEITATGDRINLYISPNVTTLTGYPLEKFNSDWNFWGSTVIHPDDQAKAAIHALRLSIQSGGEIEYRLVRADGQIIWVRDNARVDIQGDSKIVYGVVSDITEHRRIEQEAAELKVLQEVDRLRTELIDNVSHELRTPLGIIRAASSSLLANDVEFESAIQHRFLSGIFRETERLELIVNNLLSLSQLEKQQLKLDLNLVDIGRLALEVIETIQVQFKADQAGLELEANFPAEPLLAQIDARQIEQVLRNLLSNAIKYSLHGGIIILAGWYAGSQLHLSVSDQGVGIPPTDLKKIFERFYRVEQATTAHISGVGLGLAISQGIIQAHGGRIWAESQPGRGSTFHFTLPIDPIETRNGDL